MMGKEEYVILNGIKEEKKWEEENKEKVNKEKVKE